MFFLFVGEMEIYKVTENVLYRWLSTSVHIRFASVNISKVDCLILLKHLVVRNSLLSDWLLYILYGLAEEPWFYGWCWSCRSLCRAAASQIVVSDDSGSESDKDSEEEPEEPKKTVFVWSLRVWMALFHQFKIVDFEVLMWGNFQGNPSHNVFFNVSLYFPCCGLSLS